MTAFNHLHAAMIEEVEADDDPVVKARRQRAAEEAAKRAERERKRQQWRVSRESPSLPS